MFRLLPFALLASVVLAVADPLALSLAAFQDSFLWLLVLGFIVGFIMAFGIGSNDVANSFAPSVGAKSITLKQAVVLASVCEMVGVIGMGASVTDTVRKGVLNGDYFIYNPELLMMAMFSALTGAGAWLIIASVAAFPVSTTHSIIGGLIGVGMCVSYAAVDWISVLLIVMSWLTSPVLSGLVGGLWFMLIRHFILRKGDKAAVYSLRFYPLLLGVVFISVSLFIIFKNPQEDIKAFAKNTPLYAVLAGIGIGIVLAIITYFASLQYVKRRMDSVGEASEVERAEHLAVVEEETVAEVGEGPEKPNSESSTLNSVDSAKHIYNRDLHEEALKSDIKIQAIHDSAEVFPPKAEQTFNVLQVVSAAFASVSHGANDVANAIGPLASIWGIYQEMDVASEVAVPLWMLFFGGAGIIIGLLTYGYNVMKTTGIRLTKITPSRGSSIELGSAWVVLVGSNLGIPLSTTHCMVGATVGVALCEKNRKDSVHWGLFGKIVGGWVFTLFFAAVTSSAVFSFVSTVYHPRLDDLSCGATSFANVYSGIANVNSAYQTDAGLVDVFVALDTNNDGRLDSAELAAASMSTTTTGKDPIKVYAPEDQEYLVEGDWLKWRCSGYSELRTLTDRTCEPLCDSGYSLSGELKCSLVMEQTDLGNHVQSAALRVPLCSK